MSHTQKYVDDLQEVFKTGQATEHSYRAPLQNYIHALLPDTQAVNEPKRQACGAPDYVVKHTRKGQEIDIGYIEAKDIDKGLDKVEKDPQLKRYLKALDNLILTNYHEFRFYKNGEQVASIRIAQIEGIFGEAAHLNALPENFAKLEDLLKEFIAFTGQTIKSPKVLAEMMAGKARLMQDVFQKALESEEERSSLHEQYDAFKKILIHDMSVQEFSDMYAQTITYGLFTARLHDQTLDTFSRQEARELIPRSNPFLRRLFDYVCGADLDDRVVWIVDALCEVYLAADVATILSKFGKQTGRNDPIVHFYEDFLGHYDPKLRKTRGVWYTPEPVVNFIVRAIDDVLKTHFNLPAGLADTSKVTIEVDDYGEDKRRKDKKAKKKEEVHRVQLLDVAAGTGTFTAEAIKQIYEKKFKGMESMWSSYIEEHLLPRLHGFEILMASYAMCHLKIDLLLKEMGYVPTNAQKPPRLGVYLTNSLEEHHPDAGTLFASWLAAEANEASRIKKDMPIMVAYGNPPYSVSSQNKGKWITDLIADYKKDLNERNINSLSDDYVKFIRYAEHYIEKTGSGIVAMITNNSFLDGVTHRQMRKHLLETFDHIYIANLHGDSNKKEICPDGTPDSNVFDIMQGVSIAIMVKDGSKKGKFATLHHTDYWGNRNTKYGRLWEESLAKGDFAILPTPEPYYFFVPKDFSYQKKYDNGIILNELFVTYSSGVSFRKDNLLVKSHHSPTRVLETIADINNMNVAELTSKYSFSETKDWKLSEQKPLFILNDIDNVQSVLYRPFDTRYTYYPIDRISKIIPRGDSRGSLMKHIINNQNFLLSTSRGTEIDRGFEHVFCAKIMIQHHTVSLKERNFAFLLYQYPDTDEDTQGELLAEGGDGKRKPNLDEKLIAKIAKKLKLPFVPDHEDARADGKDAFSPLDVLDYIYAVLHSPTYRETYKEFLKIDFPRIPFPDNTASFWQLVALGREIRLLHLMEHPALDDSPVTTTIDGKEPIEKPLYEDGKVYINAEQHFANVPPIAWDFYIGGYQPAQKWLKDRKGRTLSYEDIMHYRQMIVALTQTDRLMKEIDEVWKP